MMTDARLAELANRRATRANEAEGRSARRGNRMAEEWVELFDEVVRLRRLLLEVTGAQKPKVIQ